MNQGLASQAYQCRSNRTDLEQLFDDPFRPHYENPGSYFDEYHHFHPCIQFESQQLGDMSRHHQFYGNENLTTTHATPDRQLQRHVASHAGIQDSIKLAAYKDFYSGERKFKDTIGLKSLRSIPFNHTLNDSLNYTGYKKSGNSRLKTVLFGMTKKKKLKVKRPQTPKK